jgi:hypothetical protein
VNQPPGALGLSLPFVAVQPPSGAFVFFSGTHGGAYANPSESQSGQRTRVARASRNWHRPRGSGSLAARETPGIGRRSTRRRTGPTLVWVEKTRHCSGGR